MIINREKSYQRHILQRSYFPPCLICLFPWESLSNLLYPLFVSVVFAAKPNLTAKQSNHHSKLDKRDTTCMKAMILI